MKRTSRNTYWSTRQSIYARKKNLKKNLHILEDNASDVQVVMLNKLSNFYNKIKTKMHWIDDFLQNYAMMTSHLDWIQECEKKINIF